MTDYRASFDESTAARRLAYYEHLRRHSDAAEALAGLHGVQVRDPLNMNPARRVEIAFDTLVRAHIRFAEAQVRAAEHRAEKKAALERLTSEAIGAGSIVWGATEQSTGPILRPTRLQRLFRWFRGGSR